MLKGVVRLIERLSWVCGAAAGLAVLALIGVMLIEVFARYVLGKPTLWAFDVSYMLNGAAFILACALARGGSECSLSIHSSCRSSGGLPSTGRNAEFISRVASREN